MTPIALQRDDGPLALFPDPGVVPVPRLVLLVAALVAVAIAPLTAPAVPAWQPVAVGWGLAVLGTLSRPVPRLGWPVPALLRALEYGAVLVLVGSSPWTYALVATLAFHNYDIVYRVGLRGDAPPRWLRLGTGGWPIRMVVLVATSPLGHAEVGALVLVVVLAPVFVVEAITYWTRNRGR